MSGKQTNTYLIIFNSLGFIKSGRYWSVSESSVSIKCQSGSKSCVNVAGNPLVMKWAGAPINLGYKCTKPSAAPVILPPDSGNSVSLQFASIQVSNIFVVFLHNDILIKI